MKLKINGVLYVFIYFPTQANTKNVQSYNRPISSALHRSTWTWSFNFVINKCKKGREGSGIHITLVEKYHNKRLKPIARPPYPFNRAIEEILKSW